ncbi:MAG: 3-deoxy-D-manno-octulosonic acid transferase [Prevotellaceae bacterium]|jgi:3-deoxy-D-manno-octulosonic-acid transferase|nr:3-deoxy-D-manno-octulosonic acid transferase [Prevotellaceae bacterium]
MNILYNLTIHAYGRLIAIAACFNEKAKKRHSGSHNTWNILEKQADKKSKYVWFHVSSLGEFEQGRPVMERLKEKNPQTKILLTFFSPSGYEIRKNYLYADIVCYLPVDTVRNVKKFFSLVNIEKAIFVKYEFWGNFLHELKNRNIPTYIISAIFRKKQAFFKIYGGFYRNMLKCFTHLFVQDSDSLKLLKTIDIYKVTVAGDTRFDRVYCIAQQSKNLPLIEKFIDGKNTVVAGSTWTADEELLLKYLNENKSVKIVIAPHEIHESHISEISSKLKCSHLRYSQLTDDNAATADCVIIDCFGILSSIYRYADIAYIGGGFGAGIHNTLEAAVYGIPVVWGTNYMKFREARELIACGGGFSVSDYNSLKNTFDNLLVDSAVGKKVAEYVEQNIGATEKILKATGY